MISNLIQPPKPKNSASTQEFPSGQNYSSATQSCARLFVNGMGSAQRERFKTMIGNGSKCGQSIADAYGVPLDEFISEVQKII